MRALAPIALSLLLAAPAHADPATERYAPAQLRVAKVFLERARAHAALGELDQAGELARQASFDARLAWAMTESVYLRAEAAEVGGAASALVTRLMARR
jgi:Domain of unknown function (DUF4398)